jgi:GT2 family glycosyltransferase
MATEWFRIYDMAHPVWPEVDPRASFAVEEVTRSLVIGNPICHSSVMMRKRAIDELGGYNEQTVTEDADLWVRAAAAGFRLGCIQLPLAIRRIHTGQHYLHCPRLPYLWAGLQVNARAMRLLGVRTGDVPLIFLRFLWSLLPTDVRKAVIKLGAGRRIGNICFR